jgi:hypothetical protein
MKKNLFLISLFLHLSFQLIAQKDFRDGFIINSSNDTLYGKIEFRSNLKNRNSCVYKNDTAVVEYLPSEIHGFGYFQDKFYTSQIIDSLYIEVLIQGELSLYKVDNLNYIIRKAGISAQYSETDQRIDSVQNKLLYLSNNVKWKGMLTVLTFDCITNTQLVQNLELDEKSLTLFVIEYNKCKGSIYHEYKKTKPWSKLEFGLSAGLAITTINFKPGVNYFTYLKDSYQSTDPSCGLLLNFSSPRLVEKLSLQVEIQYIKSRFSSDIIKSNTYYNTVMNFTSLLIPFSVKYSFFNGQYSLFMNIGANLTYNVKSESNLIIESVANHIVNTSESGAFLVNDSQFGYWAGMGISKTFGTFKMGGTIRYYRSRHYYKIEGFTVNINRISMAIIFTKK